MLVFVHEIPSSELTPLAVPTLSLNVPTAVKTLRKAIGKLAVAVLPVIVVLTLAYPPWLIA